MLLRYAAKGYDPTAINQDRNSQIPIERLGEYQTNAVIGELNNVWWSLSSYIPNAERVAAFRNQWHSGIEPNVRVVRNQGILSKSLVSERVWHYKKVILQDRVSTERNIAPGRPC